MRRRLGDQAGELGACLGGLASATVPAACRESTAQAALAVVSKGWTRTGPAASAVTLARRVHRAMFWSGLRYVFLLAMSLAAVAWASLGGIRFHTRQAPRAAERDRSVVVPPNRANQAEQDQPAPVTRAQNGDPVTFAGRVLDPEGKPRGGASVYLDLSSSRFPLHKLGITGADGRLPRDSLEARAHKIGNRSIRGGSRRLSRRRRDLDQSGSERPYTLGRKARWPMI